jgi:hypothetical protein
LSFSCGERAATKISRWALPPYDRGLTQACPIGVLLPVGVTLLTVILAFGDEDRAARAGAAAAGTLRLA